MQQEWYFIRHGQTDYNLRGIVQGSGIDSELNEKGIRQAYAFYDKYKDIAFDRIITSALQRTRQTIQPFARLGIPVYKDASINEMHWGRYEGKSASIDMKDAYKHMVTSWKAGNYDVRAEDGESMTELSTRLSGFIERLKQQSEPKILICSHGRTLRCLMALLKDGHLERMEENKHENTGLYKATFIGGKVSMEMENDTSHLFNL
ncbi:MAG: broad specificity phosphatase PhoE [Polaribacter sp.]|jgi:broad specificity phosphatase PhoE